MDKAIFIDRDGVINVEKEYLYRIEDFEFIEGVCYALKHFIDLDYKLFIVTNQSGIGRGYYGIQDFNRLTNWMLKTLKLENILIHMVYFCPHKPEDRCNCRKPSPKFLLDAQEEFNLDLENSWIIGDKESDIECGVNAGLTNTVLVKSGHKIDEKNTKAKYIVNSIFDTIALVKS